MAPRASSRRSSTPLPTVLHRGRVRSGSDPTPAQAPLQPAVHARPDPDHAWCGPPLKATARPARMAGPPTGARMWSSAIAMPRPARAMVLAHCLLRTCLPRVRFAPCLVHNARAPHRRPPPAWRLVLPTGKCGKSDYKKSLDNYELRCSGGTHRPVLVALTALSWL